MGAYNTGTSYRRTYNPCFVILFPMKHWKTERIVRITWHKQSQPNSVFPYLINASRNTFLDALVAASNSDTWPLITSTYGFPFPSFFGAFAALNVSITSFMNPDPFHSCFFCTTIHLMMKIRLCNLEYPLIRTNLIQHPDIILHFFTEKFRHFNNPVTLYGLGRCDHIPPL